MKITKDYLRKLIREGLEEVAPQQVKPSITQQVPESKKIIRRFGLETLENRAQQVLNRLEELSDKSELLQRAFAAAEEDEASNALISLGRIYYELEGSTIN